jgi:hypothetical protein
MQMLRDDIESSVAQDRYSKDDIVCNNEVSPAILQLKLNKNDGGNSYQRITLNLQIRLIIVG